MNVHVNPSEPTSGIASPTRALRARSGQASPRCARRPRDDREWAGECLVPPVAGILRRAGGGARPTEALMWGATAGRAVVPVGGQEEARAAHEPHIKKRPRFDGSRGSSADASIGRYTGRADSGRDRRAGGAPAPRKRSCGARPPGARLFRWEGKRKLARRTSPTSRNDPVSMGAAARRPMRASAAAQDAVMIATAVSRTAGLRPAGRRLGLLLAALTLPGLPRGWKQDGRVEG